jgi:hypothetical protein
VGESDSVLEGLLEGVSVGEAEPMTGDREGEGVGLAVGEVVGSLCCKRAVMTKRVLASKTKRRLQV